MLWPLALLFANQASQFNGEMRRVTSHFLVEVDVARERQVEAEASDARSRLATAEAERAVVVVCKELEDTLAWAEGLTARVLAVQAERAKAEEGANASSEALVTHLGQLQVARAQRDGTRFLFLWFSHCPRSFLCGAF